MLIAYILFCFIALFMTYRRHRREKRIRQLEDRWEEYYANQYRQGDAYNQGLRDSGTGNKRTRFISDRSEDFEWPLSP